MEKKLKKIRKNQLRPRSKLSIEMKKLSEITEVRVEEVHDMEEKQHFYRVYFHYANGKVKLIDESSTKPILARYVSKVY
jgi:hypothetical protein